MSDKFIVLTSLALLLGGTSYAPADESLVVHYEFEGDYNNSGTGTTIGQPRGGAELVADPGGGLKGPSSVLRVYGEDEYVSVGNDDVAGINQIITVAAWAKSDGTNSSDAGIVTRGYNWRLYVNGGSYAAFQCMDTQPKATRARGSVNINDGEWHHLAGLYDGTQYVLYVDGVEDGPPVPATGPIAQTTSHKLAIGGFERQSVVSKFYDGFIDDVRVYDRALSREEVRGLIGLLAGKACEPNPVDGQMDIVPDVVLRWKPGKYADKHDIYFGTDGDSVNQATTTIDPDNVYKGRQDPNDYAVDTTLELGTTYYWRIDEVNGPPDFTVQKGDVWQFTAEPLVYSLGPGKITATASSVAEPSDGLQPVNTVNGSGLDATGLLHSKDVDGNMWLSSVTGPQPTWIEYEFDRVYKLHEMWVWNFNGLFLTHFGLRDVTLEYSTDGIDYTIFGTTHEFAQAPGADAYAHNTTVDFQGVAAKHVRITALSNWGAGNQFGLSEVRFFYVPTHAREPYPSSGTEGVEPEVVLRWRAGREAASHNIYFAAEEQAVIEAVTPVVTMSETSHDAGALELGRTYYWRVDEVNEAQIPAIWQGEVWSFTTTDFLVVDDFESYTDNHEAGEAIFQTWIDGVENGTGSTVGYWQAPFAEQTIVHGGNQSMPFDYNNVISPYYSEGERTWDTPQDWTVHGVTDLALYVRGNPVAFIQTAADAVAMSGAGHDIWDEADDFRFAHQRLSGDGSITARVDSLVHTNDWAKAGVMIRESLDPGSKFVYVVVTPAQGVSFGWRQFAATQCGSSTQSGIQAPQWVKLTRKGDVFTAQYSDNGSSWQDLKKADGTAVSVSMMGNVFIGLCVTSHDAALVTTAEFSGIAATGATGPWQVAEIGNDPQPDNDPGELYVALQDSSNKVAVVAKSDPAAVNVAEWTEWRIPLSDFAGVNLTGIRKMFIGVGDRTNPQPGGAGMLYFDDARLCPSR